MTDLEAKYEILRAILIAMGRVMVAFSGGVDSSLLLKVAAAELGAEVIAITCHSPIHPAAELEQARDFAASLPVRHIILQTNELEDREFVNNPPTRCYLCKKSIISLIRAKAVDEHVSIIVEGSNADDLQDTRPGMKALQEEAVRSPLLEAGLLKSEVRSLARRFNIPVWNKPASACLASRIPFGSPITLARLQRIEKAEAFLKSMGLRVVRVRDFDPLAVIETARDEFDLLMPVAEREIIAAYLKKLGYSRVLMDLEGYRTGSLNEPEA